MSRDWEQDILEWVGDKQVKKLQSGNLIKFIISIFTAIGGFGGGGGVPPPRRAAAAVFCRLVHRRRHHRLSRDDQQRRY